MKTKLYPINRTILLTSLLTSALAAQGQTFNYNNGIGQSSDLLICIRPLNGSYDTVIDAGPVTAFTSLTAGQTITISPAYYAPSLLSYSGTNSIAWSALACARLADSNQINLWLTRPRAYNNLQSPAWPEGNYPSQANVAGVLDSIGNDAANIASTVTTPFGTSPTHTTTAVVEHEGGSGGAGSYFDSYSFLMGTLGNIGGTFVGDSAGISVEQTTAANFTSSSTSSLADFYQLLSTNSTGLTGTYLGYFTLSTNGVIVYTAGPAAHVVAQPTITSITSSGGTNVITFTTTAGDTYSLLATNLAGIQTSVTNWPVIQSGIVGSGSPATVTDVSSDSARFYSLKAF